MNIQKIVEEEHQRVLSAIGSNSEYVEHVQACLEFLSNWLGLQNTDEKRFGFYAFASELQKSTLLSFLSVTRSHLAQAHWNIRKITEAACNAAYAYAHQDEEVETVKLERSYKWIDADFPKQSAKIKSIKDYTNKIFTHSDARSAVQSLFTAEGKLWLSYFDSENPEFAESVYWLIANSTLTAVDLFIVTDLPQKTFNWNSDLTAAVKALMDKNAQLKSLLTARAAL